MKRLLTAIAALAALACAGTSCQKEFGQDTNNDKFTVTAVIEAGRQTKMSYEDQGLKPVWTPGSDIVIGFDGDGNTYGYNVTSVSSDGKAVLEIVTDGENVGSATRKFFNHYSVIFFGGFYAVFRPLIFIKNIVSITVVKQKFKVLCYGAKLFYS